MLILDTIWSTAGETGGFNIGVTDDPQYAGPIHAANEEKLQEVLSVFIGEQGVCRPCRCTNHRRKDLQRPTLRDRACILAQIKPVAGRELPPASHKRVSFGTVIEKDLRYRVARRNKTLLSKDKNCVKTLLLLQIATDNCSLG